MKRRQILSLAASGYALMPLMLQAQAKAQAQRPTQAGLPDIALLLRAGACAVMLRHAQTDPGIGDPPGFRLDRCSTQRNLSATGREQARQIGQWFKVNGLKPASVQTSAWCRCKETAELGFGQFAVLGALGSFFDNHNRQESEDSQTRELRARLQTIPAGRFEVWVTHQVNITALLGEATAMGEAMLVGSKAQVLGRTLFAR